MNDVFMQKQYRIGETQQVIQNVKNSEKKIIFEDMKRSSLVMPLTM